MSTLVWIEGEERPSVKILVAGDSHAKYFRITPQLLTANPGLADVSAAVKVYRAATITGFGKRESTLNVKSNVIDLIEENGPDILVLNFGQVDVELGMPYKQYVKQETRTYVEQAKSLVKSYSDFIDKLDFPNDRIIVKGINLPVLCFDRGKAIQYVRRILMENIESAEVRQTVLESMRSDFPGDRQRTWIAHHFNNLLYTELDGIGVTGFDLNHALTDPDTGLISTDFIPSGQDHHLVDSLRVRKLHWDELLRIAPISKLLS